MDDVNMPNQLQLDTMGRAEKKEKKQWEWEAGGEIPEWDDFSSLEMKRTRKERKRLKREARMAVMSAEEEKRKSKMNDKSKKRHRFELNIEDDGVEIASEDTEVPGLVILTNGESEYLVERIVARKYKNEEPYYEIKWVGYKHSRNTLEPKAHLKHCIDHLRKFEEDVQALGITARNVRLIPRPPPCPLDDITMNPSRVKMEMREFEDKANNSASLAGGGCQEAIGNGTTREIKILNNGQDSDEDAEVQIIDDDIHDNPNEIGEPGSQEIDFEAENSIFRVKWRPEEIPLCVYGTTHYRGEVMCLIRLKTAAEPTMKHATDLSLHNSVVMYTKTFGRVFPHLLIEHYQKNLQLICNAKPKEEQLEVAARWQLLDDLQSVGAEHANFTMIYNDMMPAVYRMSHEAVMKEHNERLSNLPVERNRAGIENKIEREQDVPHPKRLDRFGLPENYGESNESDKSDESDESDGLYESDSSDSDDYVEVNIKPPISCGPEPPKAGSSRS